MLNDNGCKFVILLITLIIGMIFLSVSLEKLNVSEASLEKCYIGKVNYTKNIADVRNMIDCKCLDLSNHCI